MQWIMLQDIQSAMKQQSVIIQKRTKEWLQGKTFDTTLPLGPHLVTKESLPNHDNLNLVLNT